MPTLGGTAAEAQQQPQPQQPQASAADAASAAPLRGQDVVFDGIQREMMHRLEPERLMRILGHDRKGQQLRMAGKGHNRRWNGQTGKFDGLCPLSGCDCAPNPLLISANVRETHLVGPSATRLRSFADTQRNSSGERYGTIIPALESEVHAMLKASCRRAGYPERDVATLKITSMVRERPRAVSSSRFAPPHKVPSC